MRDPRRAEAGPPPVAPAATPDGERDPGEADLLFALVRARYGARVSDGELGVLRQAVEAIVEQSRALRAVRLRNADEPFVTFRPDPWP